MTADSAETLRTLVLAGDLEPIVAFFEDMPEVERRALAPTAIELLRTLDQSGKAVPSDSRDRLRVLFRWAPAVPPVLATATLGELKRLRDLAIPNSLSRIDDEPPSLDVLRNRRPAWLTAWCDWSLGQRRSIWDIVRALEKEGLCEPDHSDAYVLGMAGSLRFRGGKVLDALRDDPELLDDLVWRIFEAEGFEEDRPGRKTPYGGEESTWAYALREMSRTGELDRARLLEASLEALKLDFREVQAGWYRDFHEYLEPTADERAVLADRYLDLAIGPRLPTAGFAMKVLLAIRRAGALDAANFVDRIGPALFAPTKAVVKPALTILRDIAKSDPSLRRDIARLGAIGLEHRMPELQDLSVSLLEAYGDPDDPALRDLVAERLTVIPAALKPRVSAWLGDKWPAEEPEDVAAGALDSLLASAQALPASVARRAGVDLALEELDALSGDLRAIELPVHWLYRTEMVGLAVIGAGLRWLGGKIAGPQKSYLHTAVVAAMNDAVRDYRATLGETGPAYDLIWSTRPLPDSTPDISRLGPDEAACPMILGWFCVVLGRQPEYANDEDFLITAIDDGRIDGRNLGAMMRRMLFADHMAPHAAVPALARVAETSPLHRQVVRRALEHSLGNPAADKLPHNVHMVLELLHHLCILTGEAIADPACRAFLEGRSGGSKTAKLAKSLLALTEGDPRPHRRAAAVRALAGRVARGERWA